MRAMSLGLQGDSSCKSQSSTRTSRSNSCGRGIGRQWVTLRPYTDSAGQARSERRRAVQAEQQDKASSASGSSGSSNTSNSQVPSLQEQQLKKGWPAELALSAGALAAFGVATYAGLSMQPELPPLQEVILPAAYLLLGVPLAGLLAGKAVLGDAFSVELHRGRLYVTVGVPPRGPAAPCNAVAVRPTGDTRGNGAFAAVLIPRGTYLGDYTGEVLDRNAFYARYPDGVGDYAAAIDDEYTIDAVAAVADVTYFHPVHMNHSRHRANVQRLYLRGERRISFFTSRDVQPGEELLYNYGSNYWRGREHLELP